MPITYLDESPAKITYLDEPQSKITYLDEPDTATATSPELAAQGVGATLEAIGHVTSTVTNPAAGEASEMGRGQIREESLRPQRIEAGQEAAENYNRSEFDRRVHDAQLQESMRDNGNVDVPTIPGLESPFAKFTPEWQQARRKELTDYLAQGPMVALGLTPENLQKGATALISKLPESVQPLAKAEAMLPLAIQKTVLGIANWMTTPSGAGQVVAAGLPITRIPMAIKFFADMAHGGVEASKATIDSFEKGDWQGVADNVVGALASFFGAGAIGVHGVKGAKVRSEKLDAPKHQFDANEIALQGTLPKNAQLEALKEVAPITAAEVVKEGKTQDVIPADIAKETGYDYDAGMEQMVPDRLHFTDRRKGSPTESASITVPKDATAKDVTDAFKAWEEKNKPSPQVQTGEQATSGATAPLVEGTKVVPEAPVEVGPGIVELGGATPASFEPAKPFITKNTFEQINKERKERGLEPMQEHEVFPNKEAKAQADKLMDEDNLAAEKIIQKAKDNPGKTLNPVETAVMVLHRAQLNNSYYRALKTWREAFEGGELERAGVEAQNAEFLSNRLSELEQAVGEGGTGTAAGRALQAIKMGIREDMSLEMMTLKRMKAKGAKLTIQEQAGVLKEHEALKAKINSLEKELAAEREKNINTSVDETVKESREKTQSDKRAGKQRDLEAEQKDAVDHLKETFIDNEGDLSGAELSIRKLMLLLVEREGITERLKMEDRVHEILTKQVDPTITREQAMDLMSLYGKSKLPSQEFSKRTVRDIVAQILSVRKLLDYFKGERPKLTGQLRDAPSDIQRGWIKMVNEAKKAFKLEDTGDNAKSVKSALDAINTRLKNRLTDLRQEVATRERIIRERSPSPYNEETLRLRKEIEEVEKVHKEIFGEKELTDAQRLDRAEKSAARQEIELKRQLDSGEIFPKSKQAFGLTSPKLEAAKARLEELKATRQFAREAAQPRPEPHEAFALNYLLRLRQRAAEYREKSAAGDFSKRAKKEPSRSKEIDLATADVELAKSEYRRKNEQYEWGRKTVFERSQTRAWGAYDLVRTLMSTGEFSFVLRQGKGAFLAALTSPKRAMIVAKAFRDGVRAMRNERTQIAVEQEIFTDPLYEYAKRDKLYLPKHDAPISRQEEFMSGRYSNAVPVVRAFNRAAETYLKKIRFDFYKMMAKSMTADGIPTPAQGQVIARLMNESTGRGGLGSAEQAAVALNRVFFSPRYLVSRLQMASGHALWAGKFEGSGAARKVVAKEYARMLIGAGIYYSALHLFFNRDEQAEIEKDFRSSDAGKVKKGNTRIDPMAGLAQVFTLAERTRTGEVKSKSGEIIPITGDDIRYGGDDWYDYAARFARSKLNPAVGKPIDIRVGKDLAGNTSSFTSEILESGPMTYYDIYEALREQNLSDGAAMGLLGMLGEGINTYEQKQPEITARPTTQGRVKFYSGGRRIQ